MSRGNALSQAASKVSESKKDEKEEVESPFIEYHDYSLRKRFFTMAKPK